MERRQPVDSAIRNREHTAGNAKLESFAKRNKYLIRFGPGCCSSYYLSTPVSSIVSLSHGDCIIWGNSHLPRTQTNLHDCREIPSWRNTKPLNFGCIDEDSGVVKDDLGTINITILSDNYCLTRFWICLNLSSVESFDRSFSPLIFAF